MKKFLLGVVVGLVLAVMTALIVMLALVKLGDRRPAVADGSTLILRLEGEIPERSPTEIPLPFWESQTPATVQEVWALLGKAAEDKRVRAVLLMPREVGAGWSKLYEIRESLAKFRKSGKPLVAYLRSPGSREYMLATAADRIYMAPEDFLDVKGLRAEIMFVRETLDKLGVRMEIEHIGKYKDAGDVFTRTSMTPETREVLNSVLDQLYGRLAGSIAEGRKKKPEEMRALIDEGPFLAARAKAAGLIDDLLYEDQVYGELKKRLNQNEIKKLGHREYLRSGPLPGEGRRRRIALITGEGTILRGGDAAGFSDDGAITSTSFVKLLRQVAGDSGLRGAIVRVNSPGGDAVASDEILREMKLLSEKKPLVISMSDVAASGGYYISMTGDPVVAYPDTFTGSIGVIYGKVNLRGLYDKIGVRKEILTRGRFADIDSDYQPLSDAGRKKLRESVQSVYDGFVARVAAARKRKAGEVEPLAQGRVWLGSQARERGLVDEIGGLDRAVELIRQRAKIPRDEKIRLEPYPPRRSILERLLGRGTEALIDARLQQLVKGVDLRLWARGGMLRIAPFTIEVK